MSSYLSHKRKEFQGIDQGVTFGNSSRSFNRLHTEAITIPDTNLLTFGDGTNDSPFSISCWVKIDNISRFRIFCKWDYVSAGNSNIEYIWTTDGNGYLILLLVDNSQGTTSYQGIKSASTLSSRVGVWTHLVATYDGRGGTTAKQGCFFSIDGIPMSITQAFSGASYVAMEIQLLSQQ